MINMLFEGRILSRLFMVLCVSVLSMASVQASQWASTSWDERYGVFAGGRLTVHQPLTISTNKASVFVQDGKSRISHGYHPGYDQYAPFCYLRLNGDKSGPRVVQPGQFVITEVTQSETEVVSIEYQQFAGLGDSLLAGARSYVARLRIMTLSSVEQPQVAELACAAGFEDEGLVQLPTLDEIRQALGGLATLHATAAR